MVISYNETMSIPIHPIHNGYSSMISLSHGVFATEIDINVFEKKIWPPEINETYPFRTFVSFDLNTSMPRDSCQWCTDTFGFEGWLVQAGPYQDSQYLLCEYCFQFRTESDRTLFTLTWV